jgi:hypothetical protein
MTHTHESDQPQISRAYEEVPLVSDLALACERCSKRRPVSAGIWDDSAAWSPADFGGHCDFSTPRQDFVLDLSVELVTVELAHDAELEGYGDAAGHLASHRNLTIECVRPAKDYRFVMMRAFGEECLEDVDEQLLAEFMQRVCHHTCDSSLQIALATSGRAVLQTCRSSCMKISQALCCCECTHQNVSMCAHVMPVSPQMTCRLIHSNLPGSAHTRASRTSSRTARLA